MYEYQHVALFILALAKGATYFRLFNSAPIGNINTRRRRSKTRGCRVQNLWR